MTPAPVDHPGAAPSEGPWVSWAPGTRVVVRRRLTPDEAAASGTKVTDVIGVVLATSPENLTLRRDTAHAGATPQIVMVPVEQIVAGKVVPPRPPRRIHRHPVR